MTQLQGEQPQHLGSAAGGPGSGAPAANAANQVAQSIAVSASSGIEWTRVGAAAAKKQPARHRSGWSGPAGLWSMRSSRIARGRC